MAYLAAEAGPCDGSFPTFTAAHRYSVAIIRRYAANNDALQNGPAGQVEGVCSAVEAIDEITSFVREHTLLSSFLECLDRLLNLQDRS